MKKFRTWYDDRIEEVEAVSETAKMVTIQETPTWERRTLKHPDGAGYAHYHTTWQEAKDFLINREKTAISNLAREIKTRSDALKKIEEMKNE
jgi:hypothetical protein